jgi:hypothetical protein
MASVKVGDRVRIADREASLTDAKSGLFYAYFRNLTGVIERVYDDDTVCIDVNIESLPPEVAERHQEMQTAARDKWIMGLSQEQRGRLSEQDKQFKMSYKVVVASVDVSPGGKGSPKSEKTPRSASAKSDTSVEASSSTTPTVAMGGESSGGKQPAASEATEKAKPAAVEQSDTPKRLTQKELAAKEREFLNSLKSRQTEGQNGEAR